MRVGLVLSGGGARGISHIGVAAALSEYGIVPDIISGTSSGAFVGALLAHGYKPREIIELITKTRLYSYLRLGFGVNGFLQLHKMEEVICRYLPHNSFEALQIPLIVTATDIVNAAEIRFSSGPLAIPIVASCSIPGLFSPIMHAGYELVDGGVLNNLPVEAIREETAFVIGSHCNPFLLDKPLKSTSEIVYRSLILAMHAKTRERFGKCDLLIEPPALSRFSIFDFRKAEQLFEAGYRYTKELLAEVRPRLPA
ncbi:patatin-like phospholipase family protein [Dyadobacter sandarakinus]|uniref:Patatin-like phospholipase family protein n=1 Tax=Dyadobacter sandarakinus TaxID=2747268 RepID=A0ABX7IBN7_9BACT|nr:patatin-like phospholipase family protein [Dyadobacter sandarakinus]QRR03536.1 patatin-like phospholipase family protein [Dyadobacter sandarakinus]